MTESGPHPDSIANTDVDRLGDIGIREWYRALWKGVAKGIVW